MGRIRKEISKNNPKLAEFRFRMEEKLKRPIDVEEMQSWMHLPFFVILGFLWTRFFIKKAAKFQAFIYAVLVTIAFSVLDEALQIFIPWRQASFFDLTLDFAGCFSGVLIALLFVKGKKQYA